MPTIFAAAFAPVFAIVLLSAVPLIAQTNPPAPPPGARAANEGGRFAAIDTNKDGAVSRAEWDAHQRTNDPFARMDSNKDGLLTKAEMQARRSGRHGGGHGEKRGWAGNPAAFFAKTDSDGDGSISPAEWEAAGRKPEGLARMDTDKDGKLSKAEMDAAAAEIAARRAGHRPRDNNP